MMSKNNLLDYEIDREAFMQILIARRRGKPKYKISISTHVSVYQYQISDISISRISDIGIK